MIPRAIAVAALAAALPGALAGCLEDRPGAPAVEASVLDHVEAFLAGDLERHLAFYADDWVDLGGADGTPFTRDERRARTEALFASAEYRERAHGKRPDDLLVVANATFEPAATALADASAVPERFAPQPDDVAAWLPPREGSVLFDGWFGVYRATDVGWVQVAGD